MLIISILLRATFDSLNFLIMMLDASKCRLALIHSENILLFGVGRTKKCFKIVMGNVMWKKENT